MYEYELQPRRPVIPPSDAGAVSRIVAKQLENPSSDLETNILCLVAKFVADFGKLDLLSDIDMDSMIRIVESGIQPEQLQSLSDFMESNGYGISAEDLVSLTREISPYYWEYTK